MIKFGTDGWRAVIGEAFTFENVRRVAFAHAKVLKEKGLKKVIVGYDRRFLSEDFAREVFKVMISEGISADIVDAPCTTPMVSFAVKYLSYDAGVMITASHNPPKYNGYKIKESFGGSATPSFVKEVEKFIPEEDVKVKALEPTKVSIEREYLERVRSFLEVDAFKEKEMLVVHDPMHGTASGLLAEALQDTKIRVITIRAERDPLFGGGSPEPVEKNLGLLKAKVRSLGADLGVANDGDGDRLALVDEKGNFVSPQIIYALLLLHIVRNKGIREGVVVKTVSTTYLANRICEKEGIPIKEVPVGFKNINEVILKERVIFGGEESGGFGFPEYLPERDGLMSALLILEMLSLKGVSLSKAIEDLFEEFGRSFYDRVDLTASDDIKEKVEAFKGNPPHKLAGMKVKNINTLDGLKLIFDDDSWLLMRPSGTEPLIRVYAETPSEERTKDLLKEAVDLLRGS